MTAKAESALTVSQADEAQRCLGCPVHSGVKP